MVTNLIGQNLGPYRILEQVGRGGMATVYKAYQPAMDRYVAVKVLPAHFMQDPTFVERFEREARTIARLEHPHILPVHDYGKTPEGITYIAMRYIDAGTLADLLKRGPLSLNEVTRLFSQVGDALAYAHDQGVIHRDMKPSNVLIDPRGQAFLTDFGLARMVEGDSNLTGSMIVGTPAYMAPEQGQGQPTDKRSDIYSLGIILYEMVTGRPPFEAETPLAVMIKHLTEPLPLPTTLNPNLSPAVERVILKALAKEPAARYQNVADMTTALQEAVTEAPTLFSIPKTATRLEKTAVPPTIQTRPVRRPAWLIPVVVGGILVLLIAGIALAFLLTRSSQSETALLTPTPTQATADSPAETSSTTEEPTPPPDAETDAPPPPETVEPAPVVSSGWSQFSNTETVKAITGQGDLIWVGTEGGLVVWNRADGSHWKYTTLDGLAGHSILALQVTSDGMLWAGTAGRGALRFDGQSWANFDTNSGLTADEVSSLFETNEGLLLAGTFYGEQAFSQFDGTQWSPANLPPPPLEFPKPVAFAQDQAGRLAVGLTEAGGLLIAEGDTWQHFTTANGLPSDTISSLVYDTTGNLWIVTDQPGGIGLFDGATFSTFPELAETLGTVLYGAPDGGLWLGTSYNGLWFFDGQTWNRYGEDEGLFSNHLTSIFLDDQGLFWLGTAEQGLFTYDGQSSTNWPIENEPPFNAAQQILELNDGQIGFVELYGGPDLALYNPNDDTWTTLPTPGHTQAVAIDPDGSVWFGTNDGLWHVTAEGGQQRFSTADGLPGDNITSLAFGGDGGLWIGAQTGLAYHHPGDAEVPWRNFTDYIPSPYVTLLYTDPNGQVWIGLAAAEGRPAGLAQAIDGAITGIWLAGADLPEALQPIQETISGQPFPAELESITALSLDAAGHLWVGTWNAGLWRLTLDSGDWAMLGQADGAPASSVLTITAAPDGTIWFGTWYDGLWGFNEADGWWQDTTLDGLPGQAIFATYSATDGSLWLATEGGLARQ